MLPTRDWFILGVRLLGAWLLTGAFDRLAAFFVYRFGVWSPTEDYTPHALLFYVAADLVLAAYFLLGTRHLAGLCYGAEGGKGGSRPAVDELGSSEIA